MPKVLGFNGRRFYVYIDDLPLLGHIAFGIIDRGTNVLQIRPTTICPLNCIFCSVDAGPHSRYRLSEFIVDDAHLIKWARYVYQIKQGDVVEALIDGVGDPLSYTKIADLVKGLKNFIPRVALETHGATLTIDIVRKLEEAGLDRINLSIDTLNPDKARYLQGSPWYDIEKVIHIAEFIARETSIDIHITPVWIPGVNDEDIEEIIEWGLRIGVGKRFPPFGIQKYEIHRYGRKVPGVHEVPWRKFWKFLEKLEKKYGVPLIYTKLDFGMRKSRYRVPILFKAGEKIKVRIVAPGWLYNEALAIDRYERVVISVVGVEINRLKEYMEKDVEVKVIHSKNGIYVAQLFK